MTDSEKLDVIISTLNEHTAILNEHSAILNEHTAILNEHSTMLKKHDEEISSMKFLLENEMRVNIQRVAEGHLDLSEIYMRRCDQVMSWKCYRLRLDS